MASSLIFATKKLSTILYREFTSIEIIIGNPMDKIRENTGFSFITVSFIFLITACVIIFTAAMSKRKATYSPTAIMWRKMGCSQKNPHGILAVPLYAEPSKIVKILFNKKIR